MELHLIIFVILIALIVINNHGLISKNHLEDGEDGLEDVVKWIVLDQITILFLIRMESSLEK